MSKIDERLKALEGLADYSYPPDVSEEMIRLDRNENTFIPIELIRNMVKNVTHIVDIRKYPDEGPLYNALSRFLGLDNERIVIGSGGDDIIYKLSLAFIDKGEEAIVVVPTFKIYRWAVERVRGRVKEALLNHDFSLDIDRVLELYGKNTSLIFICSPNNPTGNIFSETSIKLILENVECPVVVDETYYLFSGKSLENLFEEGFENLILLRSLSKIGFAGIRLGYLVADNKITSIMRKFIMPYSLNTFSISIGLEVVRNFGMINAFIEDLIEERERVLSNLRSIKGVKAYDSYTNFILVKLLNKEVSIAIQALRRQGIVVKDVSTYPLLGNCFRVTIGSREVNDRFLKVLEEVMNE